MTPKTNPMAERNNDIYNKMAELKNSLLPKLNLARSLKDKAKTKMNAMLRLCLSKPDAFSGSLVDNSYTQDKAFKLLNDKYDEACSKQFDAAHSFVNWLV